VTELADKKPLHFVQLDALRFLAAFLVVLVHAWEGWTGGFGIPKWLNNGDPHQYNWLGEHLHMIIGNFNFGVDMFFLISGFLITYLLLREKGDKGKINIPNFFIRRALRIWPLYFFVIAISPLLVSWMGWPSPEYKPAIFFYNNFRTIATESWQFPFAHFWSICVEEHFYLIWPFVIAFFPMKRLPQVFLTVIVISITYRAMAFQYQWGWFKIYLHTLARIDALAIGGLAAWAHFHKPFSLRMPLYARLLLYGVLIWTLSVDNINDWPTLFTAVFKKYFYLLLVGLAMMNYVFNPDAYFRWGPKHPVNYLGRACFGIYLWGNIVLQLIIHKLIIPYFPGASVWSYWGSVIGISLLLPVISYELIERPFLKLKTRFAVVKTRV
jgi:peptidoglycan/LPS O-acetylase OafA/YrhL